MNKVAKYFSDYNNNRSGAYYFMLIVGVAAVVMGIVSWALLSFAGDVWLVPLLTLGGLALFVVLSLFGLDNYGVGAMALCIFAALLALVVGVYDYFLTEIQAQAMGAGFDLSVVDGLTELIVCAAALLVCAVVANVFSWVRVKPKRN